MPGGTTLYGSIRDVPTEQLAANFVGSLIRAKGNLNEYQILTEILIRELRGEQQLLGGAVLDPPDAIPKADGIKTRS